MTQLLKYPEGHIKYEGGIKVAWMTYATEEQAKECSIVAEFNAAILSHKGFDFGYCIPGDIKKVDDGYCVTIP